ncbi:MAG: hypothetical protein MR279_05400 [Bacteroidales bacterium]|nr:hypothetical protein [Bacteroidales bacterium]MCI6800837.1 hypothetical protein [Bacteroidales bacterium]
MAWQEEPFRFLNFKECLPDKLRFWVYLLFLFVFQFSNGMYFTAMSQMQGEQSISINDVKMMSHAVLIGLTLYFPLAFRLKFRFTNRTSLIIAATGLLICNLLVPHIDKPFILVIIGFVAGFFRLYGTFECFSNILPKITPTYNYPVFLSFVFFVVLGVIHLFDALSMQIIYFFDWKQLHNLAVGLLLVVIVSAFLLMRPFRAEAKMPLLGIDFLGMLLWAIFILSLIFVVQYGNTLDWFHSPYIRVATGSAFVSLGFNIARINYIRHPFLEAAAFKVNNLGSLLIAFLCLAILLTSKNTLQNTFTASILHLDTLNLSKLKYFEFFGSVLGAVFSWFTLVRLKWSHKLVTFAGFSMILVYVFSMCFLVSPQTNMEKLYLPLMCCSFGHLAIFIALTVYVQATAPFKNYFQVLCILGFVRTGIGSPIGDAIYQHGLRQLTDKHLSLIGSNVNLSLIDCSNVFGTMATEALAAAIRELYGYTFVFGVVVLLLLSASGFKKDVKKAPSQTPFPLFGDCKKGSRKSLTKV